MKDSSKAVAVIAVVVVLLLSSCTLVLSGGKGKEQAYSPSWTNYDVIENVYPDYQTVAAEDNYYAYVFNDVFTEAANQPDLESAYSYVRDGISGGSSYLSHLVSCLEGTDFYDLLTDAAARDADGKGHLQSYVDQIDAICDLDSLKEFLKTGGDAYLVDGLCQMDVFNSCNSGKTSLMLFCPRVPHSIVYHNYDMSSRDTYLGVYSELLQLFMSEEKAEVYTADLKVLSDEMYAALDDDSTSADYTYAELCSTYEVLGYAMYECRSADRFELDGEGWAKVLNSHFNESGVETIKSQLLFSLVFEASLFLDSECYRIVRGSDLSAAVYDDVAYGATRLSTPSQLIGMCYYDAYISAEYEATLLGYIQEILDAGKEYFSGVTWLSEESRANIVKKIDSMIIRCGVSDDARSLYDYSSVDASDGLYEYIIGLKKVNVKAELSQMDRSREDICSFVWTMATQNASYCLDDNSITVLAAYVYEGLGDITTASESDIATYITFTIAHELTHAFDGNGCQYDENGTRRDDAVLTAEDRNTFQERRDRLVQYLDGLVVYDDGTTVTHVNGGNTVDEVIADLGSIAISELIFSKRSSFSYEEFYKALVRLSAYVTDSSRLSVYADDVHLKGTFRANVVLQHSRTFAEYYSLTEGDGMYIAESDRASVW